MPQKATENSCALIKPGESKVILMDSQLSIYGFLFIYMKCLCYNFSNVHTKRGLRVVSVQRISEWAHEPMRQRDSVELFKINKHDQHHLGLPWIGVFSVVSPTTHQEHSAANLTLIKRDTAAANWRRYNISDTQEPRMWGMTRQIIQCQSFQPPLCLPLFLLFVEG